MTRLPPPLLLAFLFALTASPLAFAAGGDCPATFDSDDCDVGLATDACFTGTDAEGEFLRCDFRSAGAATNATLVLGYHGASRYSAWGDVGGTKFCCAYDDTTGGYEQIKILGSDSGDNLKFTHNGTYDLAAYNATLSYATIDGGVGNDIVIGSNTSAASYQESLYGGANDDTISAGGGDDNLNGDGGVDTLLGGSGVDTMSGGIGNDIMVGGVGNDIMNGDGDDDVESGGDGNDTMDGGTGTAASGYDVLCGEGGADILKASATDGDQLYGANSGDTLYCEGSSTLYDETSIPDNCSGTTTLTERPSECP